MRRLVPLAMILSAFAFFIAAPAQAASTTSAASAASTVIPQRHYGNMCRTVRSTVKNRTGSICVLINANDAVGDLLWQGMVTFHANSGALKMVHVNHLAFVVDAVVMESMNFRNKAASGVNAFISTPWWSVFQQMGWAQTKSYKTCMYWTEGGVGCVNGWFYSRQVLF